MSKTNSNVNFIPPNTVTAVLSMCMTHDKLSTLSQKSEVIYFVIINLVRQINYNEVNHSVLNCNF